MDMPKSKQGGDNSSRKFEEVGLNLLRGYTECFPVQDFIKSDHDDLGDVDINDISEDEIRLNFESIKLNLRLSGNLNPPKYCLTMMAVT